MFENPTRPDHVCAKRSCIYCRLVASNHAIPVAVPERSSAATKARDDHRAFLTLYKRLSWRGRIVARAILACLLHSERGQRRRRKVRSATLRRVVVLAYSTAALTSCDSASLHLIVRVRPTVESVRHFGSSRNLLKRFGTVYATERDTSQADSVRKHHA